MVRRSTRTQSGRSAGGMRLLVALAVAAFSIISFLGSQEYNEVTGEKQYVSLTKDQEVALGLNAVPEMYAQNGGLYRDESAQIYIDDLGFYLVDSSFANQAGWPFEFHLLNNPDMINAFALPGGQVFITTGLLGRLETEGQVAGVLAHEIVHVLARHGAQRIAKQNLTQGLLSAVLVASENSAQSAAVIAQLVNLQYGRDDELESDRLGVRIMAEAGYDPRAMIKVMQVLAEASGGSGPPEFFSTHPNPENRIQRIEEAINELFPNGVPDDLVP